MSLTVTNTLSLLIDDCKNSLNFKYFRKETSEFFFQLTIYISVPLKYQNFKEKGVF